MRRREYRMKSITVNGRRISKVVIDEHVRKHRDITDSLILKVVSKLDGERFVPEDLKGPFEYFATLIELSAKQYRLVWLLE